MNPITKLALAESTGRRQPLTVTGLDVGTTEVWNPPSRPCPGCDEVTRPGDVITKMYQTWWHQACAESYLTTVGQDEAWRVLGRQLAARPSAFTATTTRAVVENLLRMAGAR